jgi:hypothetical protein
MDKLRLADVLEIYLLDSNNNNEKIKITDNLNIIP